MSPLVAARRREMPAWMPRPLCVFFLLARPARTVAVAESKSWHFFLRRRHNLFKKQAPSPRRILLQSVGAGDKKKFEIPKDAIAGTVKSVDEKAAKFTITVKGKDKTFTVDAKTEFWGPKGGDRGTGPKGQGFQGVKMGVLWAFS